MSETVQYANMKDSGFIWLGSIPSHWKTTRMKEIFQNITDKGHPDAEVLSLYREYGVLPKNSRDDNHNITSKDTGSYKYVQVGDLVINKMKAWQGSLGVSDYAGIVSPAYYVCHFRSEKFSKKYFHYLLRCRAYAQEFERLSTGMRIGQWDLNIDDFMTVPAVVPLFDEQQAIASFLDDQCAQIDAIIAEAKSTIEECKEWKASIIFHSVTKGLNPNAKYKDSGSDFLGQIPVLWKRAKIKNFAWFFNGDRTSRYPQPTDFVSEGVAFVNSSNLNGDYVDTSVCKYISEDKYDSLSGAKLQVGDIVYCLRGSVGKCAINKHLTQGTIASSLATIRPHDINGDFLLYCLLSNVAVMQTQIYMNGTCAANLSAENVSNYIIPLPPEEEQNEIADYLNTTCRKIDLLLSDKEVLINDLEEYKRSLIYETVTGKRKVV